MFSNLGLLVKSLRPKQWIKNLLIFAALIFAHKFFEPNLLLKTVFLFIVFCFLSGSIYIINDIVDVKKDKVHPIKSKRPIASGKLNTSYALTFSVITLVIILFVSSFLGKYILLILFAYILLQIGYSFLLKTFVIIDVLSISLGFVLRVVAGGVCISVEISSWLLICTLLLAMFLALGKRRSELVLLQDSAVSHRSSLHKYTPYLLDQMINVVTASTLMSYALYTISKETISKFGTKNLIFTIPFVLYGILRYLYLIHKKDEGGSPETTFLTDIPILINILAWILTSAVIIYIK